MLSYSCNDNSLETLGDEDDLNCSNDDDDIVIPSEPCKAFHLMPGNFLKVAKTDKETNTECVFLRPEAKKATTNACKEAVKRSKTFSPKDVSDKLINNVKLNRSDSDGAMPLYRKLPFQHKLKERRSLRLPTKLTLTSRRPTSISTVKPSEDSMASASLATKLQLKRSRRLARTKEHVMETPLDLELDLAAQRTKLDLLQSDIARLREIQAKLEDVKASGMADPDISWLQDHEYLENLLARVSLAHT